MGMGLSQQTRCKTFATMIRVCGDRIDIGQLSTIVFAIKPVQGADNGSVLHEVTATVRGIGNGEKGFQKRVSVSKHGFPKLLQLLSNHSRTPSNRPNVSQ